mmetsp:Transcript_13280/g.32471  ORF Transcript_13280/g.32471 Transcript_13280/m.32471 type:complete len:87 (-) Transcript_13280:625-885(-)
MSSSEQRSVVIVGAVLPSYSAANSSGSGAMLFFPAAASTLICCSYSLSRAERNTPHNHQHHFISPPRVNPKSGSHVAADGVGDVPP